MSGITVPMILEGERVFVDGAVNGKPVRFWVDTGGGPILCTEGLGVSENDVPRMRVGGVELDTSHARVRVMTGQTNLLPDVSPGHAESFIPSSVLARHHVVFDYLALTMSIDTNVNEGCELPVVIDAGSKFPRVELDFDGTPRGFLLDVGASMTMIPDGSAPPAWQRWSGPHGAAMYFGGRVIETLMIPTLTWGPFNIQDVMCVSQPGIDKLLMTWMAHPMFGALGGNVLQGFRITIDYPNERLFVAS